MAKTSIVMDSRLVLTVLFTTMCWGFLGQNSMATATQNMTNMTSSNMTSSNMTSSNMTSSNMTPSNMTSSNMASSNMTSTNMTSSNMTSSNMASTNMTSSNMTSSNMASSNMTSTNMTSSNMTSSNMASTNMTSSNMTSSNMASSNMTSTNMTSSNMTSTDMTSTNMTSSNMTSTDMTSSNMTSTNMTSSNMTSGGNVTTTPTMAPFVPNFTVQNLTASPSRSGCGSSRLCLSEPGDCDPSTAGSCSFISARQLDGQDFEFELSGESDGYIGTVLSVDSMLGGNDTSYVCANNNSVVQFFSALLNNGGLTTTPLDVNSVRGRVSGGTIQCTFTARIPSPTTTRRLFFASTRTIRTTSFSTSFIAGSFDPNSGALGEPTARITSNVVDLSNENATVTNTVNNSTNTTATPTSTDHGVTVHYSVMQTLLFTVVAVGLAML